MSIRDLLVIVVVILSLPITLVRPHVGVLMWSWLAYMNPHRLTWGFAYSLPFSQMVAVATLTGTLFTSEPKRIPWKPVTTVLAIWVGWMTFTTFFALESQDAWIEWERMFKVQLMNAVALMLMGSRSRINAFVWVIALSLAFYGVRGGIFTIVTGGNYMVWGPPDSFFEGNTGLGLAMLMVLPLMNYARLQAQKKWIRYGWLAAMVLTMVAVVGTYSRGAFLGAAAVLFFLWLKGHKKILVAVVLIIAVPLAIGFMPDKWMARMNTIESYEEDDSALGRINAWWFAFNIANERPITGGGFRVFDPDLFLEYAPEPENFHDAHSIYFEVLGEHGYVGLGLFLTFLALAWRTGSWTIRKTQRIDELRWASDLSRMLQVSLVAYAVSGAFLGLAYFDLFYNLVTIMVLTRVVVERHLEDDTSAERNTGLTRGKAGGRPFVVRPKLGASRRPDRDPSLCSSP
jgi:probable O-glycosylation ligase (exosortase A-associated)